jgi:3-oxoacyl-[acyl-carrier protein] reductase
MFGISLIGQIAWVTGGSRGIGRAAALALARAGADVAVGYRSKAAEAEAVVAEIAGLGRKALAVAMDVADAAATVAAHQRIVAELGKVDVLVNSAGVTRDNLFLMLEPEDWSAVLDTNVMGTVNACKCVIRDMMGKRRGRIINLSSVAATKGGRGQANYAATKGAIEAMTRSLAVELAKRNITVNCVAPGVIETDMSAEVRKLAADEILARQLVQRFGTPDEVAAWIVMLASDFGAFVTGQTMHVDGGLKMA